MSYQKVLVRRDHLGGDREGTAARTYAVNQGYGSLHRVIMPGAWDEARSAAIDEILRRHCMEQYATKPGERRA